MALVKRVLRTILCIPALIVILLFSLAQDAAVSHAAPQSQDVQPSELRSLQWWAPQVPYQRIQSRIAIVDSGVDPSMDPTGNLGRNIIATWDSVNKTTTANDLNPDKHGTRMLSAICGRDWGMVPSVPLLVVRSSEFDAQGKERPSIQGGADGIQWAADNGAQIIICPWVAFSYSSAIADAVSYAEAKGVIVVVGAGNDSRDRDQQQDCWALPNSNLLRVAAVQEGNVIAPNSAYGQGWVELAAPGDGFLQLESTATHFLWSTAGTSSAATFVGVIAAMVRDRAPWNEVIPRICNSVDLVPSLDALVFTGGVVNPQRALADDKNPLLDTLSFRGKIKKNNKKLSLIGTEVLLGQQSNQPILRIWLQNSLLGFVTPAQDGLFSFAAKGRFPSGAEVRVQSSLGGEMTWVIP